MTSAFKKFHKVHKATVLRRSTGQQIKIGGYTADKIDPKAKRFCATADDLPSVVDLREFMTPVESQGSTSSCTGNAMAGAYEYLVNRLTGQAEDVSRLFIYYNARKLDDCVQEDSGARLQNCVKVVRKYGACSEKTWAFDSEYILKQPSKAAYREAKRFVVEDAAQVEIDLQTMKACLAEGYPFVFGSQLFASFQRAEKDGLVPLPDPDTEQCDGGHAMLCVGYSDPDQVFIVRNSWGEDWGDQGYCYMPYDYLANSELSHDAWVLRQLSNLSVDLKQNIYKHVSSLFDASTAEIARAIQIPGVTETSSGISIYDETHHVTYEEQYVYFTDRGYVPVQDIENLEELYYQDYEEEYDDSDLDDLEDFYYEETSESEEYEETEDSYEDSEEFEEDESEEDGESEEDIEDSYEDEESEEDEEESEEDIEDSYEDEESEEDEEDIEDSYEDESEEDEEESEEDIEDSYKDSEESEDESEESIEDSYEEEPEDIEDSYEEAAEESEDVGGYDEGSYEEE
ncbi:C1 family peptidase [Leptolyngbya sp. FACHB-36]|uniref:C1 family peptidase n=1 Tax=Leptolyngbya sp. FACHB-36 TaxID=2692808 RepID=UPI00168176F1|nr:C1 family peptidase [Leptolyngbya sp. FACHB-36]MBD2021986.1 C1 family peptidase [Leptolyngbya sp. FACHB-36]